MKKTFAILLTILASTQAKAQFIKEKSIDISIGYGTSAPYDDVEVSGSGFYLQGEYALTITKWLGFRPYAGLILIKTNAEDNGLNEPKYKSDANAFLM
ncbi:MAG: hypothetical protein WBM53_04570 [Maribacter sp.]